MNSLLQPAIILKENYINNSGCVIFTPVRQMFNIRQFIFLPLALSLYIRHEEMAGLAAGVRPPFVREA